MADRSLSVEAALERHKDLDNWLLADLPQQNPRAWRLCVAVLLACANKGADSAPSLVAHRLADAIRRHFEPANPIAASTNREVGPHHDAQLLHQARLEYVPDCRVSGYSMPGLRFTEEVQVGQLWKVLMRSGQGLIADLLPLLKTSIEGRAVQDLGRT